MGRTGCTVGLSGQNRVRIWVEWAEEDTELGLMVRTGCTVGLSGHNRVHSCVAWAEQGAQLG